MLLGLAALPIVLWIIETWTEGLLGGAAAGLLAVPIAALLAWLASRRPVTGPASTRGAATLLLGASVGVVTSLLLADAHRDALLLGGVCLPVALFGWLWGHLGWARARAYLFPVGFTLFALPWEAFLRGSLDTPLQAWSTDIAVMLLGLAGYPVRWWNEITLYSDAYYVIVNETCSGMNMLVTLTMYALVFGWVAQPRIRNRILLIVLVFPLAMLANGTRVGVIYLLGHYGGRTLADGFWHTGSAYLIFLPVFWFLYVVNGALLRRVLVRRAGPA